MQNTILCRTEKVKKLALPVFFSHMIWYNIYNLTWGSEDLCVEEETHFFSCLGMSDPIRGDHDVLMLHILRRYRPDTVILFYTKEVQAFEEQDHRFALLKQYVAKKWKYTPEWIDYVFKERKAHKIFAEAIDTVKSVHLMQKLGMRLEGVQRSQTKDNGGNWADLYFYGLLKEDWRYRK